MCLIRFSGRRSGGVAQFFFYDPLEFAAAPLLIAALLGFAIATHFHVADLLSFLIGIHVHGHQP
jgi:hypothetical protein